MSERVLEVNGYSTFNDVEDRNVRIKNQATIIVNIILDGARKKRKKEDAWNDVQSYLMVLPQEDWPMIYELSESIANKRMEEGDI